MNSAVKSWMPAKINIGKHTPMVLEVLLVSKNFLASREIAREERSANREFKRPEKLANRTLLMGLMGP
jgi:hypothetical protein